PSLLALTTTPSMAPSLVDDTWPVRAARACAYRWRDHLPGWQCCELARAVQCARCWRPGHSVGKDDGRRSTCRHRVAAECGAPRMSTAPRYAIRSAQHAQRRECGWAVDLIAEQAVLALLHELAAWPKPGLVSRV